MSQKIPEEIFHRILWDNFLVQREAHGFLHPRYHLHKDRQVRFYALPDFQNARLVCRKWNEWLQNDFTFWKHFCIKGDKSLEVAKVVIDRYPRRLFHIRLWMEHVPSSKFDDPVDGDTSSDEEVQENEAEGPEDHGEETNVAERSIDNESDVRAADAAHSRTLHASWIIEAFDFLSPLLKECETISLHLPTQAIQAAFMFWSRHGAPTCNLRHILIEAIDYNGRTEKDHVIYMNAPNRRHHKPQPPSLSPFFSSALLLESVSLINFYVPTGDDKDIGFDLRHLTQFSMIYNRQDAHILSPLKEDIEDELLIPLGSNKCVALTLDLGSSLCDVRSTDLRHLPSLERVTFGNGRFTIGSPPPPSDPSPSSPLDVNVKNLTLKNTILAVVLDQARGIPPKMDALLILLEDMPKLISLHLIDVHPVFPPDSHVDAGPYIPCDSLYPQLKSLLVEGGSVTAEMIMTLLIQSPSLTNLTFTLNLPGLGPGNANMKTILTALATISETHKSIICPQLSRLQILIPDAGRDGHEAIVKTLSDVLTKFRAKRRAWAEAGRCSPMRVRYMPMTIFKQGYYEALMV
ncbi:hypothetical protein SISSUDRAFT_1129123 [Sistotremastrum suecicum HHB10207 ss-3]|uniref:F-box domain-containing protein n=1 Tax=Sistotremastrum suecicum HHB10207 ss-3 TaxID=1314776 RepID=A0A166D0S5_9AGAM|nr:hypothetical protein SISSUDRAFT_1129123 [Sistotremastrum suecicum HHB10207 ss-3]